MEDLETEAAEAAVWLELFVLLVVNITFHDPRFAWNFSGEMGSRNRYECQVEP